MTTYAPIKLSASTDGKAVKVAATSSTGTTVHTAHATSVDYITILACNNNANLVSRTLTLEWGTTTAADGNIVTPILAKAGIVTIIDRLPLTNSLLVTAFADVANEVLLFGWVDRVT